MFDLTQHVFSRYCVTVTADDRDVDDTVVLKIAPVDTSVDDVGNAVLYRSSFDHDSIHKTFGVFVHRLKSEDLVSFVRIKHERRVDRDKDRIRIYFRRFL